LQAFALGATLRRFKTRLDCQWLSEGFDPIAPKKVDGDHRKNSLHKMRGRQSELQLKKGQAELAERDFRKAIELAQGMSAKSLELRATMSLARLLDKQGHRDEARAMLAEIYNWFTEGFDTSDLKDTKALLDELSN
jgi:ATP/maltotriose-dependent transcriptional regulator MalT